MKDQKGFTIVELLLYMGIFSILLISLMQLFGSIIDVRLESEATSAISQDGVYILTRLTNDIHQSRIATIPSPATLAISGGTSHTYQLNGSNLEMDGSQLNSVNTTVSDLSFTLIGQSSNKKQVQLSFKLTSKILRGGGKSQSQIFSTTVGTR